MLKESSLPYGQFNFFNQLINGCISLMKMEQIIHFFQTSTVRGNFSQFSALWLIYRLKLFFMYFAGFNNLEFIYCPMLATICYTNLRNLNVEYRSIGSSIRRCFNVCEMLCMANLLVFHYWLSDYANSTTKSLIFAYKLSNVSFRIADTNSFFSGQT